MKKLMIAAAVAAMTAGAFAGDDDDCKPEPTVVGRVYQIQMNVYTTKGVVQAGLKHGGNVCKPGEDPCTVLRGKDKTVIRGYAWVCGDLCDIKDYETAFVDSRRKALFDDGAKLEFSFMNFMGANFADAEAEWDFTGDVSYDATRKQTYTLKGAGYGKVRKGANWFIDNLAGYFAGDATASYDLSIAYNASIADCICTPSQILNCESFKTAELKDANTVAFGAWKMKYNANASKAMAKGEFDAVAALEKILK